MKSLFSALIIASISISSSFANLPNGSLEYSDDAHNCVLSIQPHGGQFFDIMFDVFNPEMTWDGGSEVLFTLHQDGPDEALLSESSTQVKIEYANPQGTELKSVSISGAKSGSCSNLVLRSQIQ